MKNVPSSVVLHCSDTPDKGDRWGAEDIDQWHKKRGFSRIGYHYVVRRSGTIEAGRHPDSIGAHCQGHNQNTLGVCYIGTKLPTKEQVLSLLELSMIFKEKYQINWQRWLGHCEYNPDKTCPGFRMDLFRILLNQFEQCEFEMSEPDSPVDEFVEDITLWAELQ